MSHRLTTLRSAWLLTLASLVLLGVGIAVAQNGGASGGQTGTGQTGTGQAGAGGTQAGGTQAGTGGTGKSAPPAEPPKETPAEAKPGEKPKSADELPLFGYDYFIESRTAVEKRRSAAPTEGTLNALAGLAGPNVFVTAPDRYQLGPGDKLNIRISSPSLEPQSFDVAVDPVGSLVVPLGGPRIVVRGQTLAQVEGQIRKEVRDLYRGAEVAIRLAELRTISISLVGEAFAPGTYQVPSVATLFNILYLTGGPSDRGSLRRIQLKRNGAPTRSFDFYLFLVRGESSLDVNLSPGDVIFIPPAQARIRVQGEVFRPAVYEALPGERLRTILGMAGGIKPSGVGQRVSIESVTPGVERKLADANVNSEDESQNPALFDGDIIRVFSVRPELANAVTIEGPVDQPGQYALVPGMTVADLVTRARGLLPNALTRVNIIREREDGTTELLRADLSRKENSPVLKRNDKVVVFSSDVVLWLDGRFITIQGAVRNPGRLSRADGMTVQDAILQSGGLLPNTAMELAFIQRENPDGTPGPLERVNLMKAVQGDPQHNLALQDRDTLIVQSVQEASFTPDFSAEIEGAVLRPGKYRLARGMRVRDVLNLAGNPLPAASLAQAFIQRTSPDGTVGPLITINLDAALKGEEASNVILQDRDRLFVYTLEQAKFIVEQKVTIKGAVQRPGEYASSAGMTLADLVALAGGLLPNAVGKAEVAGAWQSVDAKPEQVPFAGDTGSYVVPGFGLKPGDTVLIAERADIVRRAPIVTILGAVKNPGAYAINGRGEKLADLLARANGFTEEAFPQGAEYIRDPKYISTDLSKRLVPRVAELMQQVSDDNYKRISQLIDLEKLRILFTKGATVSIPFNQRPGAAAPPAPGGTGQPGQGAQTSGTGGSGTTAPPESDPNPPDPTITLDNSLANLLQSNSSTPARRLTDKDLMPAGNLNIRVDRAMANPRSRDNVELKDGDVILIPVRPTSVSVVGAVALPSAILYVPGKDPGYYIEKSGWFTTDADKDSVLVIRATGELMRYRRGMRTEVGDVIFVPTRVQALRLRDSGESLANTVQTFTSAASTLAILRSLGR